MKKSVRFPHSGLLMLRNNSKTPDKAEVVIETPEGGISYEIPIIRVYHDGLAEGEAKGEAERAKLQEENESLRKEIERLKSSRS